jgi:hypothetical protein
VANAEAAAGGAAHLEVVHADAVLGADLLGRARRVSASEL